MRVKLRISKNGNILHKGIYDVSDAESLGKACADAWVQLRERKLKKTSSVGALYDALDERLLDELDGSKISLSKA
jgi:hypothetical protein